MSIGIVSDADLLAELENLKSPVQKTRTPSTGSVHIPEVVPSVPSSKPNRGRESGDVNVPDSLRQIIGEESVINGRRAALQLASQFGISSSSVSAYAKGATSTTTYDTPKPSIIQHINKSRRRSIKKATEVMNQALGAITQDKLDYTDAKDLSGIAKDMSAIIKNLEPPADSTKSDDTKTPQFVVYAPTFRDERSFDTINVTE